jgi:dTDP-4-dehydrorhamnose 3,5-epimerase
MGASNLKRLSSKSNKGEPVLPTFTKKVMSSSLIKPTSLNEVLSLSAPFYFHDFRGENIEIFHSDILRNEGIDVTFIRDSVSVSKKDVLRGLHGDFSTWKLISCLSGSIYLAVADLRAASSSFLKWEGFHLSAENRRQILVPPGVANGHLVLSDSALFFYKLSFNHDRSSQFTVRWDDPALGIYWPTRSPVLSERDAGLDPTAPLLDLSNYRQHHDYPRRMPHVAFHVISDTSINSSAQLAADSSTNEIIDIQGDFS